VGRSVRQRRRQFPQQPLDIPLDQRRLCHESLVPCGDRIGLGVLPSSRRNPLRKPPCRAA
jgi:hypothetical protein